MFIFFIVIFISGGITGSTFYLKNKLERRKREFENLKKFEWQYREAVDKFELYLSANEYFNNKKLSDWSNQYQHLEYLIIPNLEKLNTEDSFKLTLLKFYRYRVFGRNTINSHNEKFVERESKKIYKFLNSKGKINVEQSKAIAIDEDRTLLIAGAGTGKTTTIVGKIRYLTEKLQVAPSEILLLSFNRSVVDELKLKLQDGLSGVSIFTFHSLGLNIVSKVLGKRPEVAFEEDGVPLSDFLNEKFEQLLLQNDYQANVLNYFFNYLHPRKIVPSFETLDEYYQYIKNVKAVTFQKEIVKSQEEALIANFLYQNNINYLYKAPFKNVLIDSRRRPYKPSFYLPEYDLYLEYFVIDKNGVVNTSKNKMQNANFAKKYEDELQFKRKIHKQFKTTLIEIYYHEFIENTWETNLLNKLKSNKVQFLSSKEPMEIMDKLKEGKDISQFIEFCESFLSLAKAGGYNIERLNEASKGDERYFMQLFLPLFDTYEQFLKNNGKIDFHDMLSLAADYVKDNLYISPFRYIFIDEFQDFSLNKYQLVKALCDQNALVKLYCVGDDWQSIYRFSGADVSLMSNFEEYFGFTRKAFLQETHRFNNKIADLSNEFILQNPSQIRKKVKSSVQTFENILEVIYKADISDDEPLIEILGKLDKQAQLGKANYQILLLGRYNDEKPKNLKELQGKFTNLKVKFLTMHRSKGLEADYVIIINATSGRHGFPSEMIDNPLLNLVLKKSEEYPFAEERRLMYVALTRAKNKVYILTMKGKESQFINELQNAIQSLKEKRISVVCKKCGGKMIQRTGRYGEFLGCRNYPECDYTLEIGDKAKR